MKIEKHQIYSPERRTMIYARVDQLVGLADEMQWNVESGEGDAADIASRLISVAIALRLLVVANDIQPPLF